jgi:hypothetical protein
MLDEKPATPRSAGMRESHFTGGWPARIVRESLIAGNARSYTGWEKIKVLGAFEREEMTHGSGSQSTVDDENLTQFL